MPKFIRKPIVVEAEQFLFDKKPWPKGVEHKNSFCSHCNYCYLKNTMQMLNDYDWVIQGVDGPYVVTDQVFKQLYKMFNEFADVVIANGEMG
jgi:hypothetical protein